MARHIGAPESFSRLTPSLGWEWGSPASPTAGFSSDMRCVRLILPLLGLLFLIPGQGTEDLPGPSGSCLKHKLAVLEFLEATKPVMAVMAAILRIINPEQFNMCQLFSEEIESINIKDRQHMLDLKSSWATPFHCFQLVVNRETRYHRDTRGWPFGYDLLGTFGMYSNGVLSLPTIGITCPYNPGTVTGIMGKVFIHGVAPVNGERLCLAQFIRPAVLHRVLGREAPAPPKLEGCLDKTEVGWVSDGKAYDSTYINKCREFS